jgi:hypothetical protein
VSFSSLASTAVSVASAAAAAAAAAVGVWLSQLDSQPQQLYFSLLFIFTVYGPAINSKYPDVYVCLYYIWCSPVGPVWTDTRPPSSSSFRNIFCTQHVTTRQQKPQPSVCLLLETVFV